MAGSVSVDDCPLNIEATQFQQNKKNLITENISTVTRQML